MICFRDMAFCSSSHECDNTHCGRRFDDEQQQLANKWWSDLKLGGSPPIAMCNFSNNPDYCIGFIPIRNANIDVETKDE